MKNYFYLLSTCLCIGLGLVSCKKDDAPIKGDEQTQESFRANLNFEVNVNNEFPLIDTDDMELNRDELKALIKVDREGSKFVSRFNEFDKNAAGKYDKTIPVLVELRLKNNPSMVWVAEATAQTISEKRLQIRQETIIFTHLERNTALIKNDKLPFQARLTIGGTLDRDQKRIDFSAPKPIVVQAVDDSVDLSAYTGKIPYTSDWVDVKVKKNQKTNELDIEGQSRQNDQKEQEYIPFSLKPYGNFLRLSMKNTHSQTISVKKLRFVSNDVFARGYLGIGGNEHTWSYSSLDARTSEVTISPARDLASNPDPYQDNGAYLRAFLWVAPTTNNVSKPNTNILIDFTEKDDNVPFDNMRIYQKWTRGNAPRAKSTPINIEIGKHVAIQPIYFMAPNYLKGDSRTLENLRFAVSNSAAIAGNTHPDAAGDYYSVADAYALTEAGLRNRIHIDGSRWYMPTEDDIKGVFPAYYNGSNTIYNASGQTIDNIEWINHHNNTGVQGYKSLYYRPSNASHGGDNDVMYAIRFLDAGGNTTPYTAAFRYKRVGEWKDRWRDKSPETYLEVSVRPIGTWGVEESLNSSYLQNTIARESYWAEGNEGDIVRRLTPRGRIRGSGHLGNGYQVFFWVEKDKATSSGNDAYQIQDANNPSYSFFSSAPKNVSFGQSGSSSFPVILFRRR